MTITRPNQVWAMDITCIPMERGFVYLATDIDPVARRMSWNEADAPALEAQGDDLAVEFLAVIS